MSLQNLMDNLMETVLKKMILTVFLKFILQENDFMTKIVLKLN